MVRTSDHAHSSISCMHACIVNGSGKNVVTMWGPTTLRLVSRMAPQHLMTSLHRQDSCRALSECFHMHAALVCCASAVSEGCLLCSIAAGARLYWADCPGLSVLGHTSPWKFMEECHQSYGNWVLFRLKRKPHGITDTWLDDDLMHACMQLSRTKHFCHACTHA